ncbi:MAG: transpeptidase family protein [Myxococcales bacterium]|nr:transpeptidase family protein [Myxococcales bacterium]MCB9523277.1 transpeptidase family protein [Myxococcales bacterium]
MAGNVFRRRGPVEPGARKGRMLVVSILMAGLFLGLIVRSWWLQVERHGHFADRSARQHRTTVTLRAPRGPVFDRERTLLAETAMWPSVYAVPRAIENPAEVTAKLKDILPVDEEVLARRLSSDKAFVWLARHVRPDVAEKVEALGLTTVAIRPEPRRLYPRRNLAGALLGFAGIEGSGLEGVERDLDRYLQGREYTVEALRDGAGRFALPTGGVPMERLTGYGVVLTIDARIQQVAEDSLRNQVREMQAKGGVVVVMDPHNGDILALAQTPDFDPNAFRQAAADDWRNRAITDTLEPGSTMKPILISAALDLNKTRPDSVWNGYKGRMRVAGFTLTDTHAEDKLTTLEIIKYSSNIGTVQVAQRIGREAYHRYLRAFGFGELSGLGVRGEQVGTLRPAQTWRPSELATMSYGYGLSVTPIQMARAYAVIANGGNLVQPRLVQSVVDGQGKVVEAFKPRVLRRVVRADVTQAVTEGLVMVTENGGTGRRARVPGHAVAGKTGTAYKVNPLTRKYDHDMIRTSFAGFVPARDPRLVIYVAIDEPQNEKRYGGVVAAPVFSEVAREALPYLGVEATEAYTADDSFEEIDEREHLGPEAQARPWWFEAGLLTGAPSHMVVPDLNGLPLADVVRRAAELKVRVQVQGAGLVVAQRPSPGALLPADGVLTVVFDRPGTDDDHAATLAGAQ